MGTWRRLGTDQLLFMQSILGMLWNLLNLFHQITGTISKTLKRQFAFLENNLGIQTDSVNYHCFVKVCPLSESATCSKTDLTNNPTMCTAPTYYALAGRRRREDKIDLMRQSAVDGSSIVQVTKNIEIQSVKPENCRMIVDNACIVRKDENFISTTTNPMIINEMIALLIAILLIF